MHAQFRYDGFDGHFSIARYLSNGNRRKKKCRTLNKTDTHTHNEHERWDSGYTYRHHQQHINMHIIPVSILCRYEISIIPPQAETQLDRENIANIYSI